MPQSDPNPQSANPQPPTTGAAKISKRLGKLRGIRKSGKLGAWNPDDLDKQIAKLEQVSGSPREGQVQGDVSADDGGNEVRHVTYYSDSSGIMVAYRDGASIGFALKRKDSEVIEYPPEWKLPDGTVLRPKNAHLVTIPPLPAQDPQVHVILFRDLLWFQNQYVTVSPDFAVFMAAWALGTWVFGRFGAYGYPHFIGDTGKGKTRAIEVMRALCCRPTKIWTDVTEAVLFRCIKDNYPTLFIDEIDGRLHKQIGAVLRNGFAIHGSVPRNEKTADGNFEVVDHPCYCPKVLGGQAPLEDTALVSRTIEENMLENTPAPWIPTELKQCPEFASGATTLQARAFRWAIDNFFTLQMIDPERTQVASRTNQVFLSLFAVTPREYHPSLQRIVDRHRIDVVTESGETLDGQVVQVILHLYPTVTEDLFLFPGGLASEVMEARVGEEWEDLKPGNPSYVAPVSVGKVLRRLGLKQKGRDGLRGMRYLMTAAAHRRLLDQHGAAEVKG